MSPGDVLTFTTCGGLASSLAMLFAVELNGAPTFLKVAKGTLDAQGLWAFGGTVPSGLSGLVARFTSFGFYQPSTVGASNMVTVTFR